MPHVLTFPDNKFAFSVASSMSKSIEFEDFRLTGKVVNEE